MDDLLQYRYGSACIPIRSEVLVVNTEVIFYVRDQFYSGDIVADMWA